MGRRLGKELRALMVPWPLALGIAALAMLWGRYSPSTMLAAAFGLLCFAVASRVFGAEFDDRTLPYLLAQPIPRWRLWCEKMLAATTVILIGSIALGYLQRSGPEPPGTPAWWRLVLVEIPGWSPGWIPCVALATAPTVSLWLRDSLRTLWASLVLPAAVYLVATLLWALAESRWPLPPTALVLGPYCAVMLVLGYRRFSSLEIAAAGPGPAPGSARSRRSRPGRPPRGQLLELAGKEIRLHGSTLLLMPLAVAGWLLFWLLSSRSRGPIEDELVVLGGLSLAVLLVVVPALLGASTVASERQLGVIGWQLALPIARRLQWRIKLAVGMLLTLLAALLGVGFASLSDARLDLASHPSAAALETDLAYWPMLAYAFGLCGSRYARGPFQALGLGLLFGTGLWYVWRLLAFSSWTAATFWSNGFDSVVAADAFSWADPVDLIMALVVLAMLWETPGQEQWIAGRGLRRSRSVAALAALSVLALGIQAYVFTRTSDELQSEITAKDAEIAASVGTSDLRWLTRELDQPDAELAVENLVQIIDLANYAALMEPWTEIRFGAWYQPISRFMYLSVRVDGVDADSSWLDRWYWTRFRRGIVFSNQTDDLKQTYFPQRGTPGPEGPFSIAPLWFPKHRARQLDRRVRQNVTLEAVRAGQHLENPWKRDPEGFRQLLDRGSKLLRPTS